MKNIRIWLIISAVTTVTLHLILVIILKDLKISIIEFQVITHLDQFNTVIESWSERQIQSYINHLIIDYFYMFFYGLFLSLILKRVKIRFYLLPVGAVLMDLGENMIHHKIFLNPSIKSDMLIKISGSFSRIKWLTIVAVTILFIIGVIRTRIRRG